MYSSIPRSRSGFTLLEVSLAIAIGSILLTGIYEVARTTFELSDEIKQLQQKETTRKAFLDLVQNELRQLPASARFYRELGLPAEEPTLSAWIVDEAPMAFSFGSAMGHQRVELLSTVSPSDAESLVVLLRYEFGDDRAPMDLPLLDDLTEFEWRFYDPAQQEWRFDWPEPGRRPSQIELTLGVSGEPSTRHLFWIPQIVPPQLLLQPIQRTTNPSEPQP